ncbi:hypothetical protein C8Q79DRAFT_922770 [Trametes meyenii]|nr:hypothetical protein C8Q79DRAFT_922770 [Trametes meyenii]
MPQVPLELSDYIIDFLHKDARALAACSQVCRAWTPAARFHLYRAVSLQDHTFASSFQRLLNGSPDLGRYVRELTVAKFVGVADMFVPPKYPASVEQSLPRVLSHLPHLRSLTLAHMDLKCMGDLTALHHPALTAVSLSYCQFADFADIVDLANAFPRLEELALSGLTWKDEHRTPTAQPIPSLRRLVLGREVDADRLFEWFVTAGLHATITDLAARCASERDTDLVGPFLKLAGPSLRSLDLDWSFTGDKTIGLPDTVSLAECTMLDSLKLQFPIHYSTSLPWVVSLLETLESPAIKTLALKIRLLGNVNALDWEELNKVLSSPAYRSLSALSVGVNLWPSVHKDIAEVGGIVRTQLAPLEERGVLRFSKI